MPRLTKKRIVWLSIAVLVVLAIVGVGYAASRPKPPEVVTEQVKRQNLTQTVDVTGEVEAVDKLELAFASSGTLQEIPVTVGQEVKAGDLLAALDTKELQAGADAAKNAWQSALARVNERTAGASAEEVGVARSAVTVAEANLSAAQIDLQNARFSLENAQRTAVANLEAATIAQKTAADSLDNVRKDNEQDLVKLQEDLILAMKNALIAVRGGLSDADEVLGVDNSLANDGYQSVLSALDYSALEKAQNAYRQAKGSRDTAEAQIYFLSAAANQATVDAAVLATTVALQDAALTLLNTRKVLDATAANTPTFSLEELAVLKTKIDGARNAVQAAQSSFAMQTQLVASTRISAATAESSARNALSSAQQAVAAALVSQQKMIADSEASIRSAEARVVVNQGALTQARANLTQVMAGPRGVDLAALQADARSAEANYFSAQSRLEKARMTAPIAGKVTAVNNKVGEQIAAGQTLVVVQNIESQVYQIKVSVSESDVAKIKVGNSVIITFDAFGDDVRTEAVVIKIDPAEKLIEGVVNYEATINFVAGQQPSGLKPGMSADAEIQAAKLEGILVIPQRAILEHPDKSKYVRVPGGELYEERTVQTGLRGDGGLIEILSGLSEGETVILTIRNAN